MKKQNFVCKITVNPGYDLFAKSALACFPLVIFDINDNYMGVGSGCIIFYREKYIFLSVAHNFKHPKIYVFEQYDPTHCDQDRFKLENVSFYTNYFSLSERDGMPYDFAFAVLENNICAYQQNISNTNVVSIHKRKFFKYNFGIRPNKKDQYCFSGYVQDMNKAVHDVDFVQQNNIKYVREDGDSNIYVFKLEHKCPDRDYRRGCSGAPILNNDGDLISILIAGDEKKEVYGINLMRFKKKIDSEIDKKK